MYSLIQLKTLASRGRGPARSLPLRRGFLLIPLILACFAFLPRTQASPDPILPFASNTADGAAALQFVPGGFNSAFGWESQAFNGSSFFGTSFGAASLAIYNATNATAVGTGALMLDFAADNNTAVGHLALQLNDNSATSPSTAVNNTAVGFEALWQNVDGGDNTAVGSGALSLNDLSGFGLADNNTAVGSAALALNIDGFANSAVGSGALLSNTDGIFNGAVGDGALFFNGSGFSNNAFGESALFFNGIGAQNTAVGDVALAFNDTDDLGFANNNVAVGAGAMFNNVDGSENTVVGTGSGNNLIVGFNNTYVGNFIDPGPGLDEDSTIRINDISGGNAQECFIGGIFNNFQPVGGSVVEVTLDLSNDHLGWDVGPSQGAPAVPTRSAPQRRSAPLQPNARPSAKHQAMLNDKVEKLQVVVQMQQKQIVTLTAQLKEQAAQIQKVSAQLEMVRPTPRVVENR